jgi:hypothetical protein
MQWKSEALFSFFLSAFVLSTNRLSVRLGYVNLLSSESSDGNLPCQRQGCRQINQIRLGRKSELN